MIRSEISKIVLNYTWIFILYVLLCSIFETKNKKEEKYIAIIAVLLQGTIPNCIMQVQKDYGFVVWIWTLVSYCAWFLIYVPYLHRYRKGKLWDHVIVIALYQFLVRASSNYLVLQIAMIIPVFSQWIVVGMAIIFAVLFACFIKRFYICTDYSVSVWIAVIYSICTCLIMYVITALSSVFGEEELVTWYFLSVFMMLVGIMMLVGYYKVIYYFEKVKSYQMEYLKSCQYEMELENAKRNIQNAREVRHDINNHLFILSIFIREKQYNNAQNYISKLLNEKNDSIQYYTENTVVNAILNQKGNIMMKQGIEYRFQIMCPSELSLDIRDVGAVLFNLLDNAIEDSMKQKGDTFISVELSIINEYLRFIVANRVYRDVLKENKRLLTTKSDKMIHGVGLKIITQVAEKNHGKVAFSQENDMFYVKVLLLNKQDTKEKE